jgi:Tol biopolymer transport system component
VPLPTGYGVALGTFSPDAERLAVAMFRSQENFTVADAAIIDADTGVLTQPTGGSLVSPGGSHIAWTPDSSAVVFGSVHDGRTRLAVWRTRAEGVELLEGELDGAAMLLVRP